MNTKDVLNAHLYPSKKEDARRKDYPYFDLQAIATGTTEYFFFVTALSDQFARNKRLPLSGSEVFFVEEISAYIETNIDTLALIDDVNELLQQSYLQISIDNRVVLKIPGLDFIQFTYAETLIATGTVILPKIQCKKRVLPLPIIMNSTSAFEFKFVTTSAAATAFDTVNLRLVLHGLQLDKLESFYWDNLKENQFQQVPVTYYNTVAISGASADTYELFADASISQLLFSQTFPLSDIQTFSCQNIEVFVNQPDTAIDPTTIYNSRLTNILRITLDNVEYYTSSLQDMLSIFAGVAGTLTTTPDIATVTILNHRRSKVFRVPLQFPANSKVRISLEQPASSLGITGELTVAMRGIETRRVA